MDTATIPLGDAMGRPGAHDTHEVFNQPAPLVDYNLFRQDLALVDGVRASGAGWSEERLEVVGQLAGSATAIQWGFEANTCVPELRTHDRFGHRIDEVEFHPSWHHLLRQAVAWGLHSSSWRELRQGAEVARVAAFYLWSQVEAGHGCPISMTHAAVPVLRLQPDLASHWVPQLTSLDYDPGLRPIAAKRGALCGMGMTEKQGGSDVRANTTRAEPAAANRGPGAEYVLTGHKWFCSAPMCDAFLVLAQAPAGLSCFLLPRVLEDGTRNRIFIQRLKEKLGNRSNASSELEFERAYAVMVGEEGRGVRTIVEMVNYTRLDCVAGTAALMRQGVAQACHHASERRAFGHALIDQPLMQNVLADLALESEAATALMLRLARACDASAGGDAGEAHLKRVGTALGKYWVCKRGPVHTAEALECLGGNGYVEESIMPRLYREAPLNSIWEGSGNVNCLDLLRAITRDGDALEVYLNEVRQARGRNTHFDDALTQLEGAIAGEGGGGNSDVVEREARRLVERLALVLQASLLLCSAPPVVGEAFCRSRLGGDWGRSFGTLPGDVDYPAVIARAWPHLD